MTRNGFFKLAVAAVFVVTPKQRSGNVVVAIGSSVRFDGFNSDSHRVIAVDIPEMVQKDQPSRSDSGRLQDQNKRYHGIESLRHDAIIDTFSTIIAFKSFKVKFLLVVLLPLFSGIRRCRPHNYW